MTLSSTTTSQAERPVHAMSFDIEDWFPLVGVPSIADPATWDHLPSIVGPKTRWIVDTVTDAGVRATFFVLGWVARKHPWIVPYIAARGHEVACHSFWHRPIWGQSPGAFAEDLALALDVLRQQSGQAVRGYRAPSFSLIPGTEWALDVMRSQGITYDASLFPAPRAHGGYACPPEPHLCRLAPSGRAMAELPMSVMRLGPGRVAFSGGGYLRLLPPWLIRHGFDVHEKRGRPVVVYLHPHDFAPDGPRAPMTWRQRFKSYHGRRTAAGKLAMLLERYRFDTCQAVLTRALGDDAMPPAVPLARAG